METINLESVSQKFEVQWFSNILICSGLDESDTFNRHKFGYSKRSQSEESNEELDNVTGEELF